MVMANARVSIHLLHCPEISHPSGTHLHRTAVSKPGGWVPEARGRRASAAGENEKKKTKIISVPAFTGEVLWAHATLSLKLDIGTQLACA